jgi:hypothetical protein
VTWDLPAIWSLAPDTEILFSIAHCDYIGVVAEYRAVDAVYVATLPCGAHAYVQSAAVSEKRILGVSSKTPVFDSTLDSISSFLSDATTSVGNTSRNSLGFFSNQKTSETSNSNGDSNSNSSTGGIHGNSSSPTCTTDTGSGTLAHITAEVEVGATDAADAAHADADADDAAAAAAAAGVISCGLLRRAKPSLLLEVPLLSL